MRFARSGSDAVFLEERKARSHTYGANQGGAKRNPWISELKRCASAYRQEHEAEHTDPPPKVPRAAPEPAKAVQAGGASAAETTGEEPLQKYVAAAVKFLQTRPAPDQIALDSSRTAAGH